LEIRRFNPCSHVSEPKFVNGETSPAFRPTLANLELRLRDKIADTLNNHVMSPTELDALQLVGARGFINSAPTNIEHVGSATISSNDMTR
jgi:hypothetical protein